jgi:hypothetical protein
MCSLVQLFWRRVLEFQHKQSFTSGISSPKPALPLPSVSPMAILPSTAPSSPNIQLRAAAASNSITATAAAVLASDTDGSYGHTNNNIGSDNINGSPNSNHSNGTELGDVKTAVSSSTSSPENSPEQQQQLRSLPPQLLPQEAEATILTIPKPLSTSITIPLSPPTASSGVSSNGLPSSSFHLPSTTSTAALSLPITTSGMGDSIRQMSERAQQSLLNALIEANAIYAYYIDIGAPNELNLNRLMRLKARATIDNVILRAAIANNMLLSAPNERHQAMDPSRVISSKGISVSAYLTAEDAHLLEFECRNSFNECQDMVVEVLHVHSFNRFRASDMFHSLIAGLRGFTINGQPVLKSSPATLGGTRRLAHQTVAAGSLASDITIGSGDAVGGERKGAPQRALPNKGNRRIAPEPPEITGAITSHHRKITLAPKNLHGHHGDNNNYTSAASAGFTPGGRMDALAFDPTSNVSGAGGPEITGAIGGHHHNRMNINMAMGDNNDYIQSLLSPSEASGLGFGGNRLGIGSSSSGDSARGTGGGSDRDHYHRERKHPFGMSIHHSIASSTAPALTSESSLPLSAYYTASPSNNALDHRQQQQQQKQHLTTPTPLHDAGDEVMNSNPYTGTSAGAVGTHMSGGSDDDNDRIKVPYLVDEHRPSHNSLNRSQSTSTMLHHLRNVV